MLEQITILLLSKTLQEHEQKLIHTYDILKKDADDSDFLEKSGSVTDPQERLWTKRRELQIGISPER